MQIGGNLYECKSDNVDNNDDHNDDYDQDEDGNDDKDDMIIIFLQMFWASVIFYCIFLDTFDICLRGGKTNVFKNNFCLSKMGRFMLNAFYQTSAI